MHVAPVTVLNTTFPGLASIRSYRALGVRLVLGVMTLLIAAAGDASAQPSEVPWRLPESGNCSAALDAGTPGAGTAISAFPFAPGDVVEFEQIAALEPYLPSEIWEQREHFFFPGMRLEIGPCFRSYAPPEFFDEATRKFSGSAKLLAGGGLDKAPAGLPFDPAKIAAGDPEAGQKWAWNVARRYRGGGSFGEIRVTYAQHGADVAHLTGKYFVALLMNRADLSESGYRYSWERKRRWASGGNSRDSNSGAKCAFRHYRDAKAETGAKGSDDVFFYTSVSRKQERVGWNPEFPLVACAYERGFYLPRGGRTAKHRWRFAGVQDLIAPINSTSSAYPVKSERSYGVSGASLAGDRWELRRVLMLEAGTGDAAIRRYVDLETLFPLVHVEGGGRVILQYAGRWSEDRADYPKWSDEPGRPVRVVDPVIQVLATSGGGDVVRFEMWNATAIPPEGRSLRRTVSAASLRAR